MHRYVRNWFILLNRSPDGAKGGERKSGPIIWLESNSRSRHEDDDNEYDNGVAPSRQDGADGNDSGWIARMLRMKMPMDGSRECGNISD